MIPNNGTMELTNEAGEKIVAGAARYEIQNIPLEEMAPNPANTDIYETGEIDELAQSILLTGKVLQNAVVTEKDANGNYTILAGHRRWRACQKLVEEGHTEFAEIPCVVITESDELMRELILIQSNCTARVLSEAEKMRQAERVTAIFTELKRKEKYRGRVRDIVAKMLNTTHGQLSRYKVISKGLTNETLREAFIQSEIKISVAYEAARLNKKEQARLAETWVANGKKVMTLRDVKEQRKKDDIAKAVDGGVKEPEKSMEVMLELEEKAEDIVPPAEPESEKKKFVPQGECGIRNRAIEEVIIKLGLCKDAKKEEAKKCKEEGEERNEKIAMAAADFYDELIAYAEQKKADIGNCQ